MGHLVESKQCTGCRLCEAVCPVGAIQFQTTPCGFSEPVIDVAKCINCGKCDRMCPASNPLDKRFPQKAYAAVAQDEQLLMTSASGGIFAALAEVILKRNGVVYGACIQSDESAILRVSHIRIDQPEQIKEIQRSKYVQSDMAGVYKAIGNDLAEKRLVLFSGTPCQAAAVRRQFGSNELLLIVDIICHGVPSQQMFSDYLKELQKKRRNRTIEQFLFRTKESGWGLCAHLITSDAASRRKTERIPCTISSYYHMFLHGEIYRDCCYQCTYATKERVSDLTLGDYWGVHKLEPLYTQCKEAGMDSTRGISCVLVNSEQGQRWLNEADASLVESDYDSMARENHQLYEPSKRSANRDAVMAEYKANGYSALEKNFNARLGMRKYLILAKNRLPAGLRMRIRMLLGK